MLLYFYHFEYDLYFLKIHQFSEIYIALKFHLHLWFITLWIDQIEQLAYDFSFD